MAGIFFMIDKFSVSDFYGNSTIEVLTFFRNVDQTVFEVSKPPKSLCFTRRFGRFEPSFFLGM